MSRRRARRRRGDRERAGWRIFVDSIGGFLTVGWIAGAVVVVAALIAFSGSDGELSETPYVPVVRSDIDGRVEGVPGAPVRIIELSDFQCPFCRRFTLETVPTLRAEYVETGIATMEYQHFAFLGEESVRAAEAAECALEQGAFWDYHDLLFLRQGGENEGDFSDGHLKRFARELADAKPGFDVGAFDECLDSGRMRVEVEAQTGGARASGISTTPSFVINGILVTGAQPIEVFRQAIELARSGE
ncbi:MAG TPA: thioredoxin domain-containing protein [Dehalococcoidia bacterium]|nr:thioredoxin domain-containing protein [Dehalococcoidia bacterium]